MKKSLFLFLFCCLTLSACQPYSPSESTIQTAIAQTQGASKSTSQDSSTESTITATTDFFELTKSANQTQNANYQATLNAQPTRTPRLTPTRAKSLPPTPTLLLEDARQNVIDSVVDFLDGSQDVEATNLVRVQPGVLDIEIKTTYVSQEHQANVSYAIIQLLSDAFGKADPAKLYNMVEEDSFAIHLVSYSAMGDYRYESLTDLETLQKIYKRSISYEEWVTASNAGFR